MFGGTYFGSAYFGNLSYSVGATQRTISGKASILNTIQHTQTGKANIYVTTTKTQTGVGKIAILRTKTQSAKSRIIIGGVYKNVVFADGASGFWQLDDPSGATAFIDSKGVQDGVYTGTVTAASASLIASDTVGYSALFDGSSGDGKVAANATLSETVGNRNYSFEMWVKTANTTQSHGDIFSTFGTIGADPNNQIFTIYQSSFDLIVSHQYSSETISITATNKLNNTNIHHIVVTFDMVSTTQMMYLYVDGVLVSSNTLSSTSRNYHLLAQADWHFGSQGGSGFFWNGYLDGVSFYDNVLLSSSQVLNHYRAGLASTTKTQTGVTRITATTTKPQTGVTRITATTTRTQTGVTRIQVLTIKTQTGVTRVTKVTSKTQIGLARITALTTKTQTGVMRITTTTTRTQLGTTRIQVVNPKTQTGKANIIFLTTKTQTGVASIFVAGAISRTQTGVTRVTVTGVTKTQTGKTSILITSTKTITGKARITVVSARTQTGVSNLRAVNLRSQLGRANIYSLTTITQVGVTRIALPISARSLYTDKSIGQATWVSPDAGNPTSYQ